LAQLFDMKMAKENVILYDYIKGDMQQFFT